MILFRHPSTLIAAAFWTLAVIALTNLRSVHFGGLPQLQIIVAWATLALCAVLLGVVGTRSVIAWRRSGSLAPIWRTLGGTPGTLLFTAFAAYVAIGAAVLGSEAIREPDMAGRLRNHVLFLGVLAAATAGGRAMLDQIGAERLLKGVLAVLVASCAIILASPVLRDVGILAPYRIPFRLTGAFDDPNDAGLVACMTVALAVASLTNGGPRALGWLGLVAGVAASLTTASRTALVVIGALAVAFLLMSGRGKRKAVLLALGRAGVVGLAGFLVATFFSDPAEWRRLRDAPDPTVVALMEGRLCDPAPTDSPLADCAILLNVKDVLAGDMSLNWHRSTPIDRWQGVTVDRVTGRVTKLDLAGRGLNGRIPARLGRLDRLVSLSLQRNRLAGPIPPELGDLARLELLNLSFNRLTGVIPPELATLEDLEEMRLQGNRLLGAVPAAFGRLNLSVLHLLGNDFDSIPAELGTIADNDLTDTLLCAPLPSTSAALIDDCTALLAAKDVLAGDMSLNWHAAIPIGRWQGVTVDRRTGRVTEIALVGRGLNGRIPVQLGRLDRLVWLSLARNRLTGPIPPELGSLDHLVRLALQRNRLGGPVPPELGNLARLEHLNLTFNRLTGAIPPELATLDNLKVLRLRGNRLTGAVPAALGRLDLSILRLGGNDFEPIPPELAAIGDLADRLLCAPLPSTSPALIDDCTALLAAKDTLRRDASLNWHAAMPIGRWQGVTVGGPEARVTELVLPGHGLDGRIPPELGKLGGLVTLNLALNRLTGPIPLELGRLVGLRTLNLDHNALTGPIPSELARLSNLGELSLGGNRLVGLLPPELRSLAGEEASCPAARADNPGLRADCAILLALRDTLAGDALLNWSEDIPIEFWQGVAIGGSPQRVTRLKLSRSGLNGRIPPALGRLNQLVSLTLDSNRLTGSVPAELGELSGLEHLVLSANALSGPIPPQLAKLSQLGELRLQNNRLSGRVPAELAGLARLTLLRLSGNDLDRPYPRRLLRIADSDLLDTPRLDQSLPHAETAKIVEQHMNGERPVVARHLFCRVLAGGAGRADGAGSGAATSAADLQADCAALLANKEALAGDAALNWSEDVPMEFWHGVTVDGSPQRVTALELPRAGLSGRLFAELGELDGLVAVDLSHNRLAGPVPPQLEALHKLRFLRLAGNDLDRPFPLALYEIVDHDLDMPAFCRPGRVSAGLGADCTRLLTIRDSLAGDATLNWRSDVPVDDWQGVAVDRSCDCIAALDLTQMGLNGRIPAELGRLAGLVSLRLGRNRLVGGIPAELGSLVNLRMLALDGNLLTGPVPPELGKLSELADLWLRGNRLGPVPPSVAALPNLLALRLDADGSVGEQQGRDGGEVFAGNLLCRPFSEASTRLNDDCATLLNARRTLAGDVELNWSEANPIRYWRGVTVGLPTTAGEVAAVGSEAAQGLRVVAVDLSHMELNGQIPAELSKLDALAVLRLGNNQLTGAIPPALGALTELRTLVLENNALTGETPLELAALRTLVSLRLGGNELTGSTEQFATLANLRVLALEDNLLTGNIDPRLGNLSRLEELRLENNRLGGTIPDEIGRLPRLAILRLGGNALAGCVPATAQAAQVPRNDLDSADLLCEPARWSKPGLFEDGARLMSLRDALAGVAVLNWSYARPITSWQGVALSARGRIETLDLRAMGLTGRLPAELGEMSHLEILRLDGNRLAGTIPPELGNLNRLTMLSLDGNRLGGPIPPELADLANLRQLSLADNQLVGSIPLELADMHLALAIADNDFDCAPRQLRSLPSHDLGDELTCPDTVPESRPLLWRLGFEKAMQAPILGHGIGALDLIDSAPLGHLGRPLGTHNLYLILLGEAGIVPLLLFVSAIVLLLRAQWGAPQSLARDATVASVVVIALYCMAFQHLLGLAAFMFLAGLNAALAVPHDSGRHLAGPAA